MSKINLPYVQEYRDCRGKVRRYVRRPGKPRVPLPGIPGSAEFMASYESALAVNAPPPGTGRHKEGTIGALVVSFYRSAFFANLKPSSQKPYRLVLDKFAQEDGHRLVRDMPRRAAATIIEEIGQTKPGMANLSASIMRRLFAYAIKLELRDDNPFTGIGTYKLGKHHTWTESEIATFESRWPVGTRERLAFDLLLYSGQRVGDVAKMRRADLVNGAIRVTQEKTGAKVEIPIHPNLIRSLKAYPANGLMLIGSENGRPMTAKGLSAFVVRAARAAGLPAKCKPHGLRKGIMRRLSEVGSTSKEIAAVSGHKTLKEIERYTEAADQAHLARSAMARLPDQNKTALETV
jgi:integrase